MARSYRRTPIIANACCRSEKYDKRLAHRRRRATERSQNRVVDLREVSDVWSMGKDGKRWRSNPVRKLLRK